MQATCVGASWTLVESVNLPIFSPLFETHAAVARAELFESHDSVGARIHLECMWNIPCFCVYLR